MQNKLNPPPMPTKDEQWALFIDIDGTLVELVEHPSLVKIDVYTRTILEQLQPLLNGALAVLSGRSLSDVDRLLAPLVMAAGALHGLERRDLFGTQIVGTPPTDTAIKVGRACVEAASRLEGVWVEEKSGISFAIHYRNAPHQEATIRDLAIKAATLSEGTYMVQLGDCVAELRPSGADKGTALCALLGTTSFLGRRPVMIGDDITDETAFEAVEQLGGLSIIVGARRPTRASFSLVSPSAVLEWLEALIRHLNKQVGAH